MQTDQKLMTIRQTDQTQTDKRLICQMQTYQMFFSIQIMDRK